VFSAAQILVSAVVGAVASFVVLALYARWSRQSAGFMWREAAVLAIIVGLSIVLWRAAGNTESLNDDPIPLVSPNDVLCPVLTYVGLGLYAGIGPRAAGFEWQRVRALLTLVSFIVNVVTI
jgi:hypothetical protein